MSNKQKETKEMIETLALLYNISEDKLSYYDSGSEIQIFTNECNKPKLDVYADEVKPHAEKIYSRPIDSVTVEHNNGINILVKFGSKSKNKFQIQ
jgi:hypothetical protein